VGEKAKAGAGLCREVMGEETSFQCIGAVPSHIVQKNDVVLIKFHRRNYIESNLFLFCTSYMISRSCCAPL
jgi:hypothetical protein